MLCTISLYIHREEIVLYILYYDQRKLLTKYSIRCDDEKLYLFVS